MVLESLSQEKNNSRIIHIIKPGPSKTVFKLGRGHESDLRINDISVSRCHAKIKLENGKFLLEDNTSKFGTLVLVKQRTPLLPSYNKAVQVGRTVINFSAKATLRASSAASKALSAAAAQSTQAMMTLPALSGRDPLAATTNQQSAAAVFGGVDQATTLHKFPSNTAIETWQEVIASASALASLERA